METKSSAPDNQKARMKVQLSNCPQRQDALAQVLEVTFGQSRSSSAAATTSDMVKEDELFENPHLPAHIL